MVPWHQPSRCNRRETKHYNKKSNLRQIERSGPLIVRGNVTGVVQNVANDYEHRKPHTRSWFEK